jgi:hypothetical protein
VVNPDTDNCGKIRGHANGNVCRKQDYSGGENLMHQENKSRLNF